MGQCKSEIAPEAGSVKSPLGRRTAWRPPRRLVEASSGGAAVTRVCASCISLPSGGLVDCSDGPPCPSAGAGAAAPAAAPAPW